MKNFFGNKIQWVWTMRKLNTPLSVSSYLPGVKMGQKYFGYPTHLSATWYDHGDIYFDKEEIKAIAEFLRYKTRGDSDYPDKIAKHIFSFAKEIDRQTPPNTKGKSLPQLITLFKKEQKLFLQMIGFMSYRGSVQMGDILREQLETILTYRLGEKHKLNQFGQYIETLSYPYHESIIAEEKKNILRLASGFKNLTKVKQEQAVHVYWKKYEWLAYHWFVGAPPNEKQLKDRIEKLAPTAKKELVALAELQKENEEKVRTAVHDLDLNDKEKKVVRQYRAWLFLRTFVKDNINKASYKLLPILNAMGESFGIESKLMPYLSLDEIHALAQLSRQEVKKLITERRGGFSAGIVDNKFAFQGFDKKVSSERKGDEQHVKGSIAFRGKISGVAKVLLSPQEQHDLKKGEILVTPMTTPDLLPAMERAAAFVTDEGGITCHAAIVAREMKKPCIIGTRTATKQIHSGDTIEVDAENGVVNILDRANF